MLKFLGVGSAFTIKYNSNSAFLKCNEKIILFDVGDGIVKKLIKLNLLHDVKSIDIIITHFHCDHVGGLGNLIFYCHFSNIKISVIFPNKYIVRDLLDIYGIEPDIYEILDPIEIKGYYLKAYEQDHRGMEAYGYHFKNKESNFYYSGDTSILSAEIIGEFLNKEIDEIYHEIDINNVPCHFNLKHLEKFIPLKERSRVTCMHLTDNVNIEDIEKLGFKVAKEI